jgi:hypothetical protein
MGIIDDFINNSREFFRKDVNRLNNELSFAESISTQQSRLQDSIVARFADDGLIGSGIPGINTQLETLGIVDTIAGAPDIAASTRRLTSFAIDALLDPSQLISLSGALNTAAGDFVKDLIPVDILAFGPDFSFTNVLETVVGDNLAVSQVSTSLADVTQQAFIRTMNTTSLSLVASPDTLFGIFDISIGSLSASATVQIGKLDEIITLQAEIIALIASLTDDFYSTAIFDAIEESAGDLEAADFFLTNVRSQMISLGVFAESQFRNAQFRVDQAQEALDFDITTTPRILEINAKVDRLEQILAEVESGVNEIVEINSNLEGVEQDLLGSRALGMLFASQVHLIQVETRSLITSMQAAITVGRAALAVPLMAVWRTQLVILSQLMSGLPEEFKKYLSTDPQGFKADFDITVNALAALGDSGVDILVAQGKAFIRQVRLALGNQAFLAGIAALGAAVEVAANTTKSFTQGVESATQAHISPPSEVTEFGNSLFGLLDNQGLDRAGDFLRKGDIVGMLEMSRESATYSGQTLKSINDIIACLETEPEGTIDLTGLNQAKEVQNFFSNIQRSEALLSTTFGQFKSAATRSIQKIELPRTRRIKNLVDRLEAPLRASGCAEIL